MRLLHLTRHESDDAHRFCRINVAFSNQSPTQMVLLKALDPCKFSAAQWNKDKNLISAAEFIIHM